MTSSRGIFVVVEGLDRAGKSTQVARLATALGCEPRKFPDRTTPTGKMINSYLTQSSNLDDRAIHLLFSANRWEARDAILKELEQGKNVVCDRYAFSGIAYSAAKGLDYKWCRAPDIGLPAPDLTLFLHLSPEEAAKRGGYGDERYETVTMQSRVREIFNQIAAEMSQKGWVTIDAGKDMDEVTAGCLKAVQKASESIHISNALVGGLFE